MNPLCPNCQKMLTVQDHYAGQLMKCPLCAGTFTVPNLPVGGGEAAPAFAAPPPAPAGPEPSAVKSEPVPAFSTQPPAETPAFALGPPEPAFAAAPPVPPPTAPAAGAVTTEPAPPPSPGAYGRTIALPLNEKLLQWAPPAALVLVFFLQFFPWVGVRLGGFWGGVWAVRQSAWGAMYGGYTENKDVRFGFYSEETVDNRTKLKLKTTQFRVRDEAGGNAPGVSWLLIPYLLLFLVTLPLTVLVAALFFLKSMKLPPQVEQLLPWRWAIVAGLNAILLLFLVLQLVLGFGIEHSVMGWFKETSAISSQATDEKGERLKEAAVGMMQDALKRTVWLWLVVALHILATVCAALVYWVEKRGPGQPPPLLELRW